MWFRCGSHEVHDVDHAMNTDQPASVVYLMDLMRSPSVRGMGITLLMCNYDCLQQYDPYDPHIS
jgi:hypothetical protein